MMKAGIIIVIAAYLASLAASAQEYVDVTSLHSPYIAECRIVPYTEDFLINTVPLASHIGSTTSVKEQNCVLGFSSDYNRAILLTLTLSNNDVLLNLDGTSKVSFILQNGSTVEARCSGVQCSISPANIRNQWKGRDWGMMPKRYNHRSYFTFIIDTNQLRILAKTEVKSMRLYESAEYYFNLEVVNDDTTDKITKTAAGFLQLYTRLFISLSQIRIDNTSVHSPYIAQYQKEPITNDFLIKSFPLKMSLYNGNNPNASSDCTLEFGSLDDTIFLTLSIKSAPIIPLNCKSVIAFLLQDGRSVTPTITEVSFRHLDINNPWIDIRLTIDAHQLKTLSKTGIKSGLIQGYYTITVKDDEINEIKKTAKDFLRAYTRDFRS